MKLSKMSINEQIRMDIYKILANPDFLFIASQNIKSQSGNMTSKANKVKGCTYFVKARSGVSTRTLDGMSEVITRLANDLKTEKFQFSPALSVHIPKALASFNEVKPLTIAPTRDKIVQEGMRIILNAIFEPTFKDVSHGFRPNRSCHTALKFMKSQFQPCTWLIEGNISQCFSSIDRQRLMKIIEKKILDRKFTRLI
jgi:retron-type reverse transcriptase